MRDKEKYVYLTIGILRDSPTHKDLLADAEEHGTRYLPTVAGIRLGDYYRMRREGVPMRAVSKPTKDLESSATSVELSNAAQADDAWPED